MMLILLTLMNVALVNPTAIFKFVVNESNYRLSLIRQLKHQPDMDSHLEYWNLVWEEYKAVNKACTHNDQSLNLSDYLSKNPDMAQVFQNIIDAEKQISEVCG